MSVKRRLHASVVLDDKIYVIGGHLHNGVLDTVEVYDPQADSWQCVASMPRGLRCHAAAAMGGKIYVTGGANEKSSPTNSVCVYDPQTDVWTLLANMSYVRHGHASAAVGGKLYVFGGLGAGLCQSTVEVYDPASDSWVQGPSLTSARCHSMAVAL